MNQFRGRPGRHDPAAENRQNTAQLAAVISRGTLDPLAETV
jgi:hypothetical protein